MQRTKAKFVDLDAAYFSFLRNKPLAFQIFRKSYEILILMLASVLHIFFRTNKQIHKPTLVKVIPIRFRNMASYLINFA